MPLIPLLLLALAIVSEDGVVQVTTRHHPYQ